MPRPVLALPWGSRSTTRTRRPQAARAVARLIVVVVLPTPPFWLASARMRVGGVGVAMLSASCTRDLPDAEDCAGWIGDARQALDRHPPSIRGRGQFIGHPSPLEEEAEAVRPQKRLRVVHEPVQRSAGARGYDIRRQAPHL